jgi:hypothetical protein
MSLWVVWVNVQSAWALNTRYSKHFSNSSTKIIKSVKLLASIWHVPSSDLGRDSVCDDWVVFHSPSQAKCWLNALLRPLMLPSASFSSQCLSFATFNAVVWDANSVHIQCVPGGKVNILGGHSIGHFKQKGVYVHVSYSGRFPRYFTVRYQNSELLSFFNPVHRPVL